jgi:hypothetical protein
MTRSLLLALAATGFFLFVAEPASAQGVIAPGDESLQIRADYWLNELTSSVKVTSGLLTGTSVDAFETLGMDVHQQTIIPVVASYGRFGFHIEFWRNTYEGDVVLDTPIIFNGTVYPAGDHLLSKFVIDNYDARVFIDLLGQKKLDLYPLAGIRYKRYEVWLEDLTTTNAENEVLHAPMPYVGGGIRFNVSPKLSFGGELGVMNITFTEYDMWLRDYLDFSAYAELRITKEFAVVGGYRYLKFRIGAKRDDADYVLEESIQGMFLGAALNF